MKGGKASVGQVRDLRGVLDREKAAIGILITLQPPTKPILTEAASAGFYERKFNQEQFPRLQIRTVKELMEGKGIERPASAADKEKGRASNRAGRLRIAQRFSAGLTVRIFKKSRRDERMVRLSGISFVP